MSNSKNSTSMNELKKTFANVAIAVGIGLTGYGAYQGVEFMTTAMDGHTYNTARLGEKAAEQGQTPTLEQFKAVASSNTNNTREIESLFGLIVGGVMVRGARRMKSSLHA